MFAIAIFIQLYAYTIFALGLSHLLTAPAVGASSLLVGFIGLFYLIKKGNLKKILKEAKSQLTQILKDKISLIFLLLLFSTATVNIVGALGPEIAFDALWYHLTLPKLYIQEHSIRFFPGGLLYYSTMPKLIDMLYIPSLIFGNEILAKILHYLLGIMTAIFIYIFAKRYTTTRWSLAASLILYSNLVVAWQSTTAYIDLGRTLFEFLALVGFINYQSTKSKKWLLESGIILGAAISTKLIAAGSLLIFAFLFAVLKEKWSSKVKSYITFSLIALFTVSPFLLFSLISTGNPLYPLFSPFYEATFKLTLLNPTTFATEITGVFLFAQDPISPIYIIVFPLLFVVWKKFKREERLIALYSLIAIFVWYITPRTGGGRFILPYLPAFSLLTCIVLQKAKDNLQKISIVLIIITSLITIGYRAVANFRYIPVLTGNTTKEEFLTKNLNFSFGDFYDTDGYLQNTITNKDTVLVYGIHNLYYLNVPFIHESYVKKGDEFNYILIGKDASLPQRFEFWDKIYTNTTTGVSLYTNNKIKWVY